MFAKIIKILVIGKIILGLGGCGAKRDPYGVLVNRVSNISIQGNDWFSQGNYPKAAREFNKALELSRSADYRPGVAQQLNNLGAVALDQGDLEKAQEMFTQAWQINEELQSWAEASTNQANLATVAQKKGKMAQAEQHLQSSWAEAQKSKSSAALGRALCRLAGYYLDAKDFASAQKFLQQAQPLASSPDLQGAFFHQWGRYNLAQTDLEAAWTNFSKALEADRKLLDRAAMAADLFALGETRQAQGEWREAFDYFGRAFDIYVGLSKKARLQDCLKQLQEANKRGKLGYSLQRFETHALLTSPVPKP